MMGTSSGELDTRPQPGKTQAENSFDEHKRKFPYPQNTHNVTRLNLQHLYYTIHTGYLLHPDVELKGSDLRVADVGTGTGYQIPRC